MTSTDIILLLIIAGAFLIGFFWGVIRGLIALAAWFVVFILSAHVSLPVGDYLTTQWTQYGGPYDHMLAWLLSFGVGFAITLALIVIGTRGSQDLSRYPLLDDLIGGLLGVAIAVLVIAAVIAILQSFYGSGPPAGTAQGAQWSSDLYRALIDSTIGGRIADSLVPVLMSLLAPLLPATINSAFDRS
jgi:uncharacterized membrane protein required for colicin V production